MGFFITAIKVAETIVNIRSILSEELLKLLTEFFNAIAKWLYEEVKNYIKDLLTTLPANQSPLNAEPTVTVQKQSNGEFNANASVLTEESTGDVWEHTGSRKLTPEEIADLPPHVKSKMKHGQKYEVPKEVLVHQH